MLHQIAQEHIKDGNFFRWVLSAISHRILLSSHPLRALKYYWRLHRLNLNEGVWLPRRIDRWLWACEQTWKLPPVSDYGTFGDLRIFSVSDTKIAWPVTVTTEGLSWVFNEIFVPRWRNPYSYEINPCRIKRADWVLDIGACEGFFTLYAAQLRHAHVIAFEPVSEFSSSLRATVCWHGLSDRVEVLDYGLTDSDQDGFFDKTGSPFTGKVSDSHNGLPIRLRSLDSLVSEGVVDRVDFIKMDVEGSEEAVVRGATSLIRNQQPRLAIAVYHTPTQGEEVKNAILAIDPTYKIAFRGMWLRDLKAHPRPATLFAWPSSKP